VGECSPESTSVFVICGTGVVGRLTAGVIYETNARQRRTESGERSKVPIVSNVCRSVFVRKNKKRAPTTTPRLRRCFS